jgi:transposase InsO family protein
MEALPLQKENPKEKSHPDSSNIYSYYYYTPRLPSAFGGVDNFTRHAPKSLSSEEVKDWLEGEDAYTLHKPIVRKFSRRDTIVAAPLQQFQADLLDVQSHHKLNKGYKYILTVIDVFSKHAWAIPLKNKTGVEVSQALDRIFSEEKPSSLQTDKGKEFLNIHVAEVLAKNKIKHFTTQNASTKASIVERFNRTLRNSLHRRFTVLGEERFVDILPDVLEAYNNRFHTSLGTTPSKVEDEDRERLWYRLYDPLKAFESPPPKLKKGDWVRITKTRTAFQRGYTPNWSVEVFRVSSILPTTPVTYTIQDWGGENILGSFYEQELQKIKEPQEFKVEKVLRKKTEGGIRMVLVKWLGYPDKFNQWIPEDEIKDSSKVL